FYDPAQGAVKVGGMDLRDASFDSLRRSVVVIPQEGFLFNGTIGSNVRMGRIDATDSEVSEALNAIGILDRFESLPEGLDTPVSQGGTTLSSGEKQLISLARVALVDPRILILDEATSNLDPATEAVVESAIDKLAGGKTLISIAHRLTTAQRADRVVVVADGQLAEVGSHDELVALGGTYAKMYSAWLGQDPLD
ncbi:MAG TPA: ABC transporter ATP-binding protein, partial [Acidimicrobiales bacterium]|nr:ABC transporter ATP-binding protein [Acidimicrobiales bacterium]